MHTWRRTSAPPRARWFAQHSNHAGDELTTNPLWQQDAYRMIQRRAKAAGIRTHIGNYSFRATGVAAYLKKGGRLKSTP